MKYRGWRYWHGYIMMGTNAPYRCITAEMATIYLNTCVMTTPQWGPIIIAHSAQLSCFSQGGSTAVTLLMINQRWWWWWWWRRSDTLRWTLRTWCLTLEVEMEMVLEGVWWRCLTVCLYAVLAWNARHEECERTGISVETNWWWGAELSETRQIARGDTTVFAYLGLTKINDNNN